MTSNIDTVDVFGGSVTARRAPRAGVTTEIRIDPSKTLVEPNSTPIRVYVIAV